MDYNLCNELLDILYGRLMPSNKAKKINTLERKEVNEN
jgi:hypothetical protein